MRTCATCVGTVTKSGQRGRGRKPHWLESPKWKLSWFVENKIICLTLKDIAQLNQWVHINILMSIVNVALQTWKLQGESCQKQSIQHVFQGLAAGLYFSFPYSPPCDQGKCQHCLQHSKSTGFSFSLAYQYFYFLTSKNANFRLQPRERTWWVEAGVRLYVMLTRTFIAKSRHISQQFSKVPVRGVHTGS